MYSSLGNISHTTYLYYIGDKYAIVPSSISSQNNGFPLAKLDTVNITSLFDATTEQSEIIRISFHTDV